MPDGRGFAGGWGPLPGPWLQPGFREKGFVDLDVSTGIVADLIDRFNAMMSGLPAMAGFGHVHYLDLRKTLPNKPNHKKYWADELHPSRLGFSEVAKRYATLLAKI